MKNLRYIVVALMAMIAADALAWTAEVNKAILMLTEENLSKSAGKQVAELLGTPLSDYKFENGGKSKTRLNAEGKSVTTDEKDAVVQLEKAIALLGNKSAAVEARKAALQTAIEKSVDIHCPSNILIDKLLEGDFKFGRDNGRPKYSRWYKVDPKEWGKMWHSNFHTSLGAFSAEMYLYDWRIATKGMAKKYKKQPIAPRAWAEQTGAIVIPELKIFKPESVVDRMEITKLEEVNNGCMYAAAFRLADMLNQILK
jgi:hypothetical protein